MGQCPLMLKAAAMSHAVACLAYREGSEYSEQQGKLQVLVVSVCMQSHGFLNAGSSFEFK